MVSARNSYDEREFENSMLGSWAFCGMYLVLFIKEIINTKDYFLVCIAGIFLAAVLMYEIVRSHKAVKRIVSRYDAEVKELNQKIKQLDDELFELKYRH